MKRKFTYRVNKKIVEREVNHIPIRYIIAIMLSFIEVVLTIGVVIIMSVYIPYFYVLAFVTHIACIVRVIASEDNPDYKIPWLVILFVLPIAGFMLYFMFYSRKLKRKYTDRLIDLNNKTCTMDDSKNFNALKNENPIAHNQAKILCNLSMSHLFTNTRQEYFPSGESMHKRMLEDLKNAEKFIYMEYFIIEEGVMWQPPRGGAYPYLPPRT